MARRTVRAIGVIREDSASGEHRLKAVHMTDWGLVLYEGVYRIPVTVVYGDWKKKRRKK